MNLINEIQAKGLLHRCGEDTAYAISLTEAKEIMELVKQRCKGVVEKELIDMSCACSISAIKAIEGIE